MKKLIYSILVLIGLAGSGLSAPPTAINSYYTNTVLTSGTFTNAGDTGLSVSNVYICIPLTSITNAQYVAANITNDVRPFISTMLYTLDVRIDAQASTNQFTTFEVTESSTYTSATNRTIYRAISEQQIITITPSYPTE